MEHSPLHQELFHRTKIKKGVFLSDRKWTVSEPEVDWKQSRIQFLDYEKNPVKTIKMGNIILLLQSLYHQVWKSTGPNLEGPIKWIFRWTYSIGITSEVFFKGRSRQSLLVFWDRTSRFDCSMFQNINHRKRYGQSMSFLWHIDDNWAF